VVEKAYLEKADCNVPPPHPPPSPPPPTSRALITSTPEHRALPPCGLIQVWLRCGLLWGCFMGWWVLNLSRSHQSSLQRHSASYLQVDARDSEGRTALHLAAGCGDGAMVLQLVKLGSDVNCKDSVGGASILPNPCLFTYPHNGHIPLALPRGRNYAVMSLSCITCDL